MSGHIYICGIIMWCVLFVKRSGSVSSFANIFHFSSCHYNKLTPNLVMLQTNLKNQFFLLLFKTIFEVFFQIFFFLLIMAITVPKAVQFSGHFKKKIFFSSLCICTTTIKYTSYSAKHRCTYVHTYIHMPHMYVHT